MQEYPNKQSYPYFQKLWPINIINLKKKSLMFTLANTISIVLEELEIENWGVVNLSWKDVLFSRAS